MKRERLCVIKFALLANMIILVTLNIQLQNDQNLTNNSAPFRIASSENRQSAKVK